MDVSMTASYTKLRQCTGDVQQDALARAEDALNATMEMLGSENEAPDASGHQMQLGMESGLLLFCFVICFSGFRFVRMVNLCVGFWLGGCLALFFLELVAPQIAQETCYLVVPLVLTAAMLMSILCAVKRQSLYFVLGAIAAQFFGAASYNILVMAGYGRTAQGTTINEAARGCTSFFAVLGATLVYFYADVAWNAATALIGAYGTAFFGVKLAVIPYVDEKFSAFTEFRPETIVEAEEEDIFYIYLPFALTLLLAIAGFFTQRACSKSRQMGDAAGGRKGNPVGSPTRVMV